MKPDQSDGASTLAKAQAKAAERFDSDSSIDAQIRFEQAKLERRCIFHHSVPANQGFEIKAGFVCYGHSAEFDTAGS